MQTVAAPLPSAVGESGLIPQPDRPSQFPIRVPVVVECGAIRAPAEVLGSTPNVLLLQSSIPDEELSPLGTPVKLSVEWDRQQLSGRMAAHGVGGRFLVTLGERAIRRSRRFVVDLPATVRSSQLYGTEEVRIADLSAGGARIEGLSLPVGSELELTFTPPGRQSPITVLAFVVRVLDQVEEPSVGVAFRMVQSSIEVLGRAAQRTS